jgi:hypothetical protein
MLRVSRKQNYIVVGSSSGSSGGTNFWTSSGNDIYNNNSGNVGINIQAPEAPFDVSGQTILRTPLVKIGINAGSVSQQEGSIAIGSSAGQTAQGFTSIAIGRFAGASTQGDYSTAIGFNSGRFSQGGNAISIGYEAGYCNQFNNTIAVGYRAGESNQRENSIAIGRNAGEFTQGTSAIAIGLSAGQNSQGTSAIAIGSYAGYNTQQAFSIVIDASATSIATSFQVTQQGFYVRPIRNSSDGAQQCLTYDTNTREITRNTAKTFVIDHPLDDNKYLVHGCLEGPEIGVYYRGEGKITNDESVEISLPNYTKNFSNFSIQITPINSTNIYGVSRVNHGKFKVFGKNGEFFWFAFATRDTINVEPNKYVTVIKGDGPYKYIDN